MCGYFIICQSTGRGALENKTCGDFPKVTQNLDNS